ncbi:tetratricopeptide repeat protein [Clostridium sp. Marseille-P299]|uniref:tetratricopeptide repeat protein n=1 Tax=Clostridium sp. Marseille-P299 TaxID=1805477 RepID=UPI00082A1DAF|nr:tetratricopeptide repeat protein [Clostridium sp. Marseille-P299]
MNCPYCGNVVAVRRNRCDMCGKDLTTYKRVYRVSNMYYNQGLEKAKVRDLSGAVLMLKKSLEMNKRNTNARNLLGLVFYEMGEIVAALSEWVISKHFQSNENDADVYMGEIQANPTKLDNMNQAIKKYNFALESAKQGNYDLAIIQLKKVVSLNPHFIRALQLLALLYMKNNEFERARRALLRASKIDISNTTTLRYLSELNSMLSSGNAGQAPYWSNGDLPEANNKGITPISSYREEKPNVLAFVNLVLGVIIGIAVVFFLIVPTVKSNIRKEYAKEELDYSSQLNVQLATINSKEKEIETLTTKLEEAERKLADEQGTQKDNKIYDNLLSALKLYTDVKAINKPSEDELLTVAKALYLVDAEKLTNKDASELYDLMKSDIYPSVYNAAFLTGRDQFDAGEYEKAVESLLEAYAYNPTYDYTLYYLGKAYQELDNDESAKIYYNELLENCPDSTLRDSTNTRLNSLQ